MRLATASPVVEAVKEKSRYLVLNSAWTEYRLSVVKVCIAKNLRTEGAVQLFTKISEARLHGKEVTLQNIRH